MDPDWHVMLPWLGVAGAALTAAAAAAWELRRRGRDAARALQSAESWYRAVVESSDDAIIGKDLNGTILSWNAAAQRLFGYAADEALGRPITMLFPPGTEHEETVLLHRIRSGEHISHYEAERICRDGRTVTVSLSISPIKDASGRVVGASKIARDITERRRIEAELRDSRQHLALLIDRAPVALALFDRSARCLLTSRRWSEEYGVADGDRNELSKLLPHAELDWSDVQRRALAGETMQGDALPVSRAAGGRGWLRWAVRPWRDDDGNIGGLVAFTEDVSGLIEAQREIERLNADLQRRVDEGSVALSGANDELDAFTYAVAHEMRAPLRAMSGFSQALIDDHATGLDGEARVYLEQIDAGARRMAALVDGILALARSARSTPQRVDVDLAALARKLLLEFERRDRARPVDWQVDDMLPAHADPRLAEVALRLLLDNAWKFSANEAQPRIRVSAVTLDGVDGCCIEDNGAGFDMRHAARLFKPFQRLHRHDEFPGVGVGLATAQRIVQRHGGRIDIDASPGAGCRVRFTLPRA
ncbi:phytochrome-like protein cph1 [mine drainage metagenome]|jgi:PAS domain S-box-containing protein|uniref:histidine kinase n=1 Tax=mine drainage metagenome TaxID=410659 RepID=A0A1J5QUM0_9ZZZZ